VNITATYCVYLPFRSSKHSLAARDSFKGDCQTILLTEQGLKGTDLGNAAGSFTG
jgi:hypothetical protein